MCTVHSNELSTHAQEVKNLASLLIGVVISLLKSHGTAPSSSLIKVVFMDVMIIR